MVFRMAIDGRVMLANVLLPVMLTMEDETLLLANHIISVQPDIRPFPRHSIRPLGQIP